MIYMLCALESTQATFNAQPTTATSAAVDTKRFKINETVAKSPESIGRYAIIIIFERKKC